MLGRPGTGVSYLQLLGLLLFAAPFPLPSPLPVPSPFPLIHFLSTLCWLDPAQVILPYTCSEGQEDAAVCGQGNLGCQGNLG